MHTAMTTKLRRSLRATDRFLAHAMRELPSFTSPVAFVSGSGMVTSFVSRLCACMDDHAGRDACPPAVEAGNATEATTGADEPSLPRPHLTHLPTPLHPHLPTQTTALPIL